MFATTDDLVTYGYDVAIATMLPRADKRVRGYLVRRASAVGLFADDAVIPPALAECVCAIADRMSSTDSKVGKGVQQETAGGQSVTFGGQAYAGLTDLTAAEKVRLDELFPRMPFTVDHVCEDA